MPATLALCRGRTVNGLAVLTLSAASALAGCALVATPFAATENRTAPAVFTLPDRPTAVVVDADPGVEFAEVLIRQVTARAADQLRTNGALPTAATIDPAKVQALRDVLGEGFDSLAIDEIGRRVGAETVIYARIDRVQLNVQGTLYKPAAGLTVKVIDSLSGERLFPDADASGLAGRSPSYPVAVEGVYEDKDSRAASRTTDLYVARALGDDAGLSLARLFYDWERPEPGSKAFEERERHR